MRLDLNLRGLPLSRAKRKSESATPPRANARTWTCAWISNFAFFSRYSDALILRGSGWRTLGGWVQCIKMNRSNLHLKELKSEEKLSSLGPDDASCDCRRLWRKNWRRHKELRKLIFIHLLILFKLFLRKLWKSDLSVLGAQETFLFDILSFCNEILRESHDMQFHLWPLGQNPLSPERLEITICRRDSGLENYCKMYYSLFVFLDLYFFHMQIIYM